jgi:hypothetical protein
VDDRAIVLSLGGDSRKIVIQVVAAEVLVEKFRVKDLNVKI